MSEWKDYKFLLDDTVWLTQKVIAELFQKDVRTINEHINNIFEEGELIPDSVIRKFRITAADGKNYLNSMEFETLNRIVSMYLDFAECRNSKPLVGSFSRLEVQDYASE